MNIFFLHTCPELSAKDLCDKHVVKMVLETAQMCSTALRRNGLDPLPSTYKTAFKNHPMTLWVGDCKENFMWALDHGLAIGKEYTRRYGRDHKSTQVLQDIKDAYFRNSHYNNLKWHISTPPQCMPDEFKCDDYVEAYRAYYKVEKAAFLDYTNSQQPAWL